MAIWISNSAPKSFSPCDEREREIAERGWEPPVRRVKRSKTIGEVATLEVKRWADGKGDERRVCQLELLGTRESGESEANEAAGGPAVGIAGGGDTDCWM